MPAPHSGDTYLHFNGTDAYVEIPSIAAYSVPSAGGLTVTAWMRPDVPNFPNFEDTHYVHWLGKGEGSHSTGQQEWTFRMYNRDGTTEKPPRPSRISFYVFNSDGGLGVGSYVQHSVRPGHWLHLAGVVDSARTYLYENGSFARCDTYRGPAEFGCPIHFQERPHEHQQLVINPHAGGAPVRLGTRDFKSYFDGGLARVRIWARALGAPEIAALYHSETVDRTGLVAEFLLDADLGNVARDTAKGNNGTLFNATWAKQT